MTPDMYSQSGSAAAISVWSSMHSLEQSVSLLAQASAVASLFANSTASVSVFSELEQASSEAAEATASTAAKVAAIPMIRTMMIEIMFLLREGKVG